MKDLFAIILKDTYSLSQLKHRLTILKAYLLKTFFGSSQQTPPLSKNDLNWLNSLPESFYQQFNKDNVYKTFADLENTGLKSAFLTMYLTFEPDDETLEQIGNRARKLFGPDLILDVKFDPTLIAGCSLVWNGIQKDYSLRAKIEEKKPAIIDGFKRFIR